MRVQANIPVPEVMVMNVGGATGVHSPGYPEDGAYALDMQVPPNCPLPPPLIQHCETMLCSVALQSVVLPAGVRPGLCA